ncbi:hypothetical protein [Dankookia sp. P2]|uniref:hypothetical protein n=1 Tax=Dankookia sp. P2 TaxID=3423955 RepID=UPI003D67EEF9
MAQGLYPLAVAAGCERRAVDSLSLGGEAGRHLFPFKPQIVVGLPQRLLGRHRRQNEKVLPLSSLPE